MFARMLRSGQYGCPMFLCSFVVSISGKVGLGVVYKTPIRHILLKKLENPALAVSIQEAADAGKF